jgi:ABC-type enterobactin transport system permease subunit
MMLHSRTRLIALTAVALAITALSTAFVGALIYGTLLMEDEEIPLQWLVMTPLMVSVLVVMPAALVSLRGARHLWLGDEVSLSDVTAPPNRLVSASLLFLGVYMATFYVLVPAYEWLIRR